MHRAMSEPLFHDRIDCSLIQQLVGPFTNVYLLYSSIFANKS